jgi:3-deoxy-D-manno-octulosonic-acid transferase
MLLRVYKKLADANVTLVLAPRHFEKADQVEANIRAAGCDCVRRSRGDAAKAPRSVFLADTTGELMGLYGLADAVFVGKSLCAHGSQNMIEPCLCGKPTVVGPYTENFRPVMSDLLAADAIVQAKDEREIERTILGWFAHGDGGLGGRAAAAVARRCGVVAKCVAEIREAVR